jgi:heptosyltransferase-2
MATASFARIRAAFPSAHLVLGVRSWLEPLLHGTTWFDAVLPAPKAKGVGGLMAQVRHLRDGRFDLAIVMPNSLESGLTPFLARVPLRLGYRQGRPLLMNLGLRAQGGRPWWRRVGPRRTPVPMPLYYQSLLDVLGLPAHEPHPILAVTAEEEAAVDRYLAAKGVAAGARMVLLCAGASYGASKMWDPEGFAAVARHFAGRGFVPVFLAGPAEVEMVEAIAQRAGAVAATRPVLPLDQLKALMRRGTLLVTTDTGPRHIGVAFDLPIVCVIGPTDRRYTNYCLERTVLVHKDLECMPCQRKVCPLGHHLCMKSITADEVIRAAESLLARS